MPTLRQLWSRGQQVILSYEDEASVSRHVELWPGIPYWWGNKVKPQDLVHYLERMKSCGRPGECRLAPGHLVIRLSEGFGLALGSSGETEHDVLGDVTVSTTGGQDVDIRAHSIVSTTQGQDVDIFGVTVQPACPL